MYGIINSMDFDEAVSKGAHESYSRTNDFSKRFVEWDGVCGFVDLLVDGKEYSLEEAREEKRKAEWIIDEDDF